MNARRLIVSLIVLIVALWAAVSASGDQPAPTLPDSTILTQRTAANVDPHPLLSDIRIRRALAYCTDRTALIASVYPFLNATQQQALLMDTFLPKAHWAYHAPAAEYTYPFDPPQGRQLLDDVGWALAPGATYRTNAAGYELALKLTTTTAQFRQTFLSVLENQLRDNCGIRLLREHISASIWFGNASGLQRRDFELGEFAWVGQADPGARTLYACDQIPTAENGWVGQNYMGWCDLAASNAIIAANNTLLRQERINQYAIVQEEFAEDMVSLPLFGRVEGEAWSLHVSGIPANPTDNSAGKAAHWARDDGGTTIVAGSAQEPWTLFTLVTSGSVVRQVAHLAKGVYFTQYDYDFQPILQDGLSTLESGLAQNATVTVTAGDRVVNSRGEAVTLTAGVKVIDATGNEIMYSGTGTIQMKQLTVTYKLKAYTWSDGVAGTTEDIELGVQAECDPDAGATTYAICDAIQHTAFGPGLRYTLTYLPGYQNPLYFVLPFGIYPAHQVLGDGRVLVDVPASEWAGLPEIAERPLSFGPFKLTEWVKGDHMTFDVNPHHVPAPSVNRIIIRFFGDTTQAVSQLLDGQIDFVDRYTLGAGVEAQQVADAAAAGQINAKFYASPTWEHMDMNLDLYTQVASKSIPAAGGALATDFGVALTVPAGAVDDTTTFLYNHQSTPAQTLPPSDAAATSFTLEAFAADGSSVTDFAAPLTIEVRYTTADLVAQFIMEGTLNLAFWDGSAWQNMLPCTGCSLDTANNRVTVVVDHLSDFTLRGKIGRLYLPLIRR